MSKRFKLGQYVSWKTEHLNGDGIVRQVAEFYVPATRSNQIAYLIGDCWVAADYVVSETNPPFRSQIPRLENHV